MSRSKHDSPAKRLGIAAGALLITGGLLAGGHGIAAYLTDAEKTTNTFTVGNVKIDLVEPTWPGNDSDDVKDLVPNQPLPKDPHIINTGENDTFVFSKIWVPLREIAVVNNDGTFTDANNDGLPDKSLQEVFKLYKGGSMDANGALTGSTEIALSGLSAGDTPLNSNWVFLKSETNVSSEDTGDTTKYNVYTFGYNKKLIPEGDTVGSLDNDRTDTGNNAANDYTTTNLFDFVRLKNIVDGEIAQDDVLKLHVGAYAIQADHVLDANGNNVTDLTNVTNMQYVFNAYFNQNAGKKAPDARGYEGDFDLTKQHNKYGIPQGDGSVIPTPPAESRNVTITYHGNLEYNDEGGYGVGNDIESIPEFGGEQTNTVAYSFANGNLTKTNGEYAMPTTPVTNENLTISPKGWTSASGFVQLAHYEDQWITDATGAQPAVEFSNETAVLNYAKTYFADHTDADNLDIYACWQAERENDQDLITLTFHSNLFMEEGFNGIVGWGDYEPQLDGAGTAQMTYTFDGTDLTLVSGVNPNVANYENTEQDILYYSQGWSTESGDGYIPDDGTHLPAIMFGSNYGCYDDTQSGYNVPFDSSVPSAKLLEYVKTEAASGTKNFDFYACWAFFTGGE